MTKAGRSHLTVHHVAKDRSGLTSQAKYRRSSKKDDGVASWVNIFFNYFVWWNDIFVTYILVHSLQWSVIPIIGNGSDDLPIGTYAYLIGPVGVCFAATGNGWYCVRLHEPAEPL